VATTSGNNVPVDNVPAVLQRGAGVVDVTTPAAIPPNTSVTNFSPYNIIISNNVAGGGVLAGDTLGFSAPGPVYAIKPGLTNGDGNGFWMSVDGSNGQSTSISWNGYVNAWSAGPATLWTSSSYLGYVGAGGNSGNVVFPSGIMLGGENNGMGQERMIWTSFQGTNLDYHLQGDTLIYSATARGGALIRTNTPAFNTTLSAAVTGGTTTSVPVAACPNPALPAGTPIIFDYPSGVYEEQKHLGDLASCSGATLTLQSAASNTAANGSTIRFMQWFPAAPIANDTGGKSWTLGNYMTLTPVALASLPSTCTAGTFAVINNGVASPTYNATVGSTTGSATDPVFCTNGNVWKYH
jgi:hypothetical protein